MKRKVAYCLILFFILTFFVFPSSTKAFGRQTLTVDNNRHIVFINGRPFFPIAMWNPFISGDGDLLAINNTGEPGKNRVYDRIVALSRRGFNTAYSHLDCLSFPTACDLILDKIELFNRNTGRTDPNDQMWAMFSIQPQLYGTGRYSTLSREQRIAKAKDAIRLVVDKPFFLGVSMGDEPETLGLFVDYFRPIKQALENEFRNKPKFLTYVDQFPLSNYKLAADAISMQMHCGNDQEINCYNDRYYKPLAYRAKNFVDTITTPPGSLAWGTVHAYGNYAQMGAPVGPTAEEEKMIVKQWVEGDEGKRGVSGLLYFAYFQGTFWRLANHTPSPWNDYLYINRYAAREMWKRHIPQVQMPLSLLGDFNVSGKIDVHDYNRLVGNYNSTSCNNIADIDSDCKVNYLDYRILVDNFSY